MKAPFAFLAPARILGSCLLLVLAFPLLLAAAAPAVVPPRLMEKLGRGIIAMRESGGSVYVSWRLLGTDPEKVAFNLYRIAGPGTTPAKLNPQPIADVTFFVDATPDFTKANAYFVRAVLDGQEQEPSKYFVLPANAPARNYLAIPLQVPKGGVTPTGENYTYSANDCSVGDLDGDGEYEMIVKWDPSNSKDNSQTGFTGNVYLDAYKLDGRRLWRIDLGRNIRAGAHYTQFMVYDLDGDGKAEVACRTSDGTIDGLGKVIGSPVADYRTHGGKSEGFILTGPEYLTIFNGLTGAAMASVPYIPARGNFEAWGDNYGNRVDRFLACVAYLDGQRPSLVMCRGYYTRTALTAWNWRDGKLTKVWAFDVPDNTPYAGQGNHGISVADVDGSGKDVIIYGSMCVNSDGSPRYSAQLHHGDAMHVSDLDPNRPGLEIFDIHEHTDGRIGVDFRDANTGKVIWSKNATDVGRGSAFDIDPRYPGYEMWAAGDGLSENGIWDVHGKQISAKRPKSVNFGVWWDGDLLRELLDKNYIDKWDWIAEEEKRIFTAEGCESNNSSKATPCLSGDILGDWREEVVWRTTDSKELRIYSTTIPTKYRIYTLMHDRQYRLAMAWQNVAYNQPPHPGFFLGDGMKAPPRPNIVTSLAELKK